jgi:hypothetical protein
MLLECEDESGERGIARTDRVDQIDPRRMLLMMSCRPNVLEPVHTSRMQNVDSEFLEDFSRVHSQLLEFARVRFDQTDTNFECGSQSRTARIDRHLKPCLQMPQPSREVSQRNSWRQTARNDHPSCLSRNQPLEFDQISSRQTRARFIDFGRMIARNDRLAFSCFTIDLERFVLDALTVQQRLEFLSVESGPHRDRQTFRAQCRQYRRNIDRFPTGPFMDSSRAIDSASLERISKLECTVYRGVQADAGNHSVTLRLLQFVTSVRYFSSLLQFVTSVRYFSSLLQFVISVRWCRHL